MADKPCRWVEYMSHHIETETEPVCKHPLAIHLAGGLPPECHGCPCHEPQPEVVKESLTTRPDQKQDTCRWWKDEYGNWCCACSDTLPDFTPWRGTAPDGCFCPKCGEVITARVHDKP